MVALVFILIFVLTVAVLAFDAYLLSTHVPTLIEDPSNYSAWLWTLVAVIITLSFVTHSSKSTP